MRQAIVEVSVVRAAEQASEKDLEVAEASMDEEDALNNALDIVEEAEEAEQHKDADKAVDMVMEIGKVKEACTTMGTAMGSA